MGMCALLLFSRPVQAEMYVAGQIGAHLPNDASNLEFSASGVTIGASDLALQNSLMYGGKLGYYFDRMKLGNVNFGVETEVFNTTPHIKQQAWMLPVPSMALFSDDTALSTALFTMPGLSNRVLTWAPVVALVRYQAGAFEPYAGVGLGVFFSRLSASDFSSSSIDVGLNTQVGIRYRAHKNLSLFTEWKYNYANISHTNIFSIPGIGAVDLSYNYSAHIVAGGIAYHF